MAEIGWIKLHRKVLDCWIWQEKPYDKARAWVDLLLLAMHHDKKLFIENEVVIVPRGSFMTSIVKLANRWGWSRCKVMRYLELLESEQMLNTKRTPKGTLVTIVKYEDYQINEVLDDTPLDTTLNTSNDTTDDTPLDTTDDTTVDTQNKNIKNIKNNKNVKNNIGRFTPPHVIDVQAYCYERGNNVDAQAFVDFYSSKGWMVGKNKMKDWKAAVRTWERNRSQNSSQQKTSQRDEQFNKLMEQIRRDEENAHRGS